MHKNILRLAVVFPALVCLALVLGGAIAADPPQAPKVSSFAAVADITAQVEFYLGRLDEVVASDEEFSGAGKQKLIKDANTLAVLSLALGLTDEEFKAKKSAAGMIKAAQGIAAAKELAGAKSALADYRKAYAGEGASDAELKWDKVASLSQLMKQVPVINAAVKRGLTGTRFKSQAKQTAAQAAALAAIAQAAMVDTHEVKDPKDLGKWYEYCAEMRDGAAAIAAAAKKGDQEAATAGMQKLSKSCDTCHAVFRKEVKSE